MRVTKKKDQNETKIYNHILYTCICKYAYTYIYKYIFPHIYILVHSMCFCLFYWFLYSAFCFCFALPCCASLFPPYLFK